MRTMEMTIKKCIWEKEELQKKLKDEISIRQFYHVMDPHRSHRSHGPLTPQVSSSEFSVITFLVIPNT